MINQYTISILVLNLFIGTVAFMAGCDTVDSTSESGTFSVLLTDAPGDFKSAVLTIERVYLQAEDDEDDAGRIVLRDEAVTVDLLTLQNEVFDLVDGEDVPEGVYAQLRLVISGGYIEVEREDGSSVIYASSDSYAAEQGVGSDGMLQMPSFAQSGLKVVLPAEAAAVEGDQHVVLLDFDVSESFGHKAGQSGMWVMNPVIRASDLSFTGTAEVALSLGEDVALPTDSLASFAATLDKGGDVLHVPFADSDGDGTFTADFRYLAPGAYPVDVVAPEGLAVSTDATLPLEITIESGEVAEAALTVTAVTVN